MFEQITRPFAIPDILVSGRIVASKRQRSSVQSRLVWGTVGDIAAPVEEKIPLDPGFTVVIKDCDVTLTETSRKTKDVDFKNKDDTSQFVTVRQIQEIKFQKPDKNENSMTHLERSLAAIDKHWDDVFNSGTTKKCDQAYQLHWLDT